MTAAPQNIYDDPTFFAGYRDLRTRDTGLNGVLEVPALLQLLPALAGAHVLDLGCGFGDFARPALAHETRRPPFLVLKATRPAQAGDAC